VQRVSPTRQRASEGPCWGVGLARYEFRSPLQVSGQVGHIAASGTLRCITPHPKDAKDAKGANFFHTSPPHFLSEFRADCRC